MPGGANVGRETAWPSIRPKTRGGATSALATSFAGLPDPLELPMIGCPFDTW
jgi:hypothetical protein